VRVYGEIQPRLFQPRGEHSTRPSSGHHIFLVPSLRQRWCYDDCARTPCLAQPPFALPSLQVSKVVRYREPRMTSGMIGCTRFPSPTPKVGVVLRARPLVGLWKTTRVLDGEDDSWQHRRGGSTGCGAPSL
jgi:hypothetical protein